MTAPVNERLASQIVQANGQPQTTINMIGTMIGKTIAPVVNNSKTSAAVSVVIATLASCIVPSELKTSVGLLTAGACYLYAKNVRVNDVQTASREYVQSAEAKLARDKVKLARLPALERENADLIQSNQAFIAKNKELLAANTVLKDTVIAARGAKDTSLLFANSTQSSQSSVRDEYFAVEGASQSAMPAQPANSPYSDLSIALFAQASAPLSSSEAECSARMAQMPSSMGEPERHAAKQPGQFNLKVSSEKGNANPIGYMMSSIQHGVNFVKDVVGMSEPILATPGKKTEYYQVTRADCVYFNNESNAYNEGAIKNGKAAASEVEVEAEAEAEAENKARIASVQAEPISL